MSLPQSPAADDLHSGRTPSVEVSESDPIVAEVRAIRDEYAKSFGYDLAAIVADLRAREERHPERVVSLSPKRIKKS